MPVAKAKTEADKIIWKFQPSLLMPGDYELLLDVSFNDNTREAIRRNITITPARTPWKNLQICTWNETGADYADSGVTIGGSMRLDPTLIDFNTCSGLYSEFNWVFLGNGRNDVPGDWAMTYDEKKSHATILSEYVRQSVVKEAKSMARQLDSLPSLKMLIINTERHAGSTSFDYSAGTIEMIRNKFGVDLSLWRDSDLPVWHRFRPLGWLGTRVVPHMTPKNGIIMDNDPLYSMHRWWHGPEGGSDVVVNDLMAEIINKAHPEVITAKEPIARRPALRSYSKINTAQDWTYYAEMSNIIRTAEMNYALSRHQEHMAASTMPQFLLKKGMAAPFDGMPTVDMFREAVWLVCSRPARLLTFWNAGNAFRKGDQQTVEEIRQLIGDETDAEKIVEKKLKLKAWEPGIQEEFKALSDQLWKPFGALFPQWKNAPRRVAVLNSFVSHLYGNQRWPNGGWLTSALVNSGVPYDTILDNDLEIIGSLKQYDVIVLPEIYTLTESMLANLKEAQTAGCKLVADEVFKIDLPGVIVLKRQHVSAAVSNEEIELLKKYNGQTDSPQYVEAMEQLSLNKNISASPELNELLGSAPRSTIVCKTSNTYWNLLEAEGVSYLVAVSDRRIPGELYGKYGKVREKGIAHTVEFELKGQWSHGWDLTGGKEINISESLKLQLPPCGGRIIMLSDKPLGELIIKTDQTPVKGKYFTVNIAINSMGLIPVELQIVEPDGRKNSSSHYNILRNGILECSIPIAYNAPDGLWTLKVRELASGKQKEYKFTPMSY